MSEKNSQTTTYKKKTNNFVLKIVCQTQIDRMRRAQRIIIAVPTTISSEQRRQYNNKNGQMKLEERALKPKIGPFFCRPKAAAVALKVDVRKKRA